MKPADIHSHTRPMRNRFAMHLLALAATSTVLVTALWPREAFA